MMKVILDMGKVKFKFDFPDGSFVVLDGPLISKKEGKKIKIPICLRSGENLSLKEEVKASV